MKAPETLYESDNSLQPTNQIIFLYPNKNSCRKDLIMYAHAQTTNWKWKYYGQWSTKDLLSWICHTAMKHNREYEKINMENFMNISPKEFALMSIHDFITLTGSKKDGEILYYSKENLVKQSAGKMTPPHKLPGIYRRKQRGRPRKHFEPIKQDSRKCKLWEFLRNLLHNPATCPSLIKWDNFEEGSFKFVQSETVAKLWGIRNQKHNDNMNFEKLSRAMRYYYKDRILEPVNGKRLVYKFGPNAVGWKTNNPIL